MIEHALWGCERPHNRFYAHGMYNGYGGIGKTKIEPYRRSGGD